MSSESSCDRAGSPSADDQRSPKRRRVLNHISNCTNLQLSQKYEKSVKLVGPVQAPNTVRSTNSTGSFNGEGTKYRKHSPKYKNIQIVSPPACFITQGDDAGEVELQGMNPDVISRLVEMADNDSRLMHLVEVLFDGKASFTEREEWEKYYNSLPLSTGYAEDVQYKKHTDPLMARQQSQKATPAQRGPLCSVQSSMVAPFRFSDPISNQLSPPYSPRGPHDGPPAKIPREDEVVFLHERPLTPPKPVAALGAADIANSPLFISPGKPLAIEKSIDAPVVDPFAQAKRKRAQGQADLREKKRTLSSSGAKHVKVTELPTQQTSASRDSRRAASQQILPVEVRNLENRIAEYEAEIRRRDAKSKDLSIELDEEKSKHRLSLEKSKQRIAGLKRELQASQRAAEVAQTRFRELRLKMEPISQQLCERAPKTLSETHDSAEIELANLRSEVTALRSLVAAKDKPYPRHEFINRKIFLAPLVLSRKARTLPKRGRGRPPKSTSSPEESDTGTNASRYDGEQKDEEDDSKLRKNAEAMQEFDKAIGLLQNPIPVRVDGMLAYRDGARVRSYSAAPVVG